MATAGGRMDFMFLANSPFPADESATAMVYFVRGL